MGGEVPRRGVERALKRNQLMLRSHEQRNLTSGCTRRRAGCTGVGYFVTRGFAVRSNQQRFQVSSHFAARVSRDPLGCARDCAHINGKVVSGKFKRHHSRVVGECGSPCGTWQWMREVARVICSRIGSAPLQDLSS